MASLKKVVQTAVAALLCGIGLCFIGKKFRISERVADKGQSVGNVPVSVMRAYSLLSSSQIRPMYGTVASQIVSMGHFEKILDLGTGLGYLPIEIALRLSDVNIYGVDESPNMVRLAITAAGIADTKSHIEYTVGSYGNLPFPGRYFDFAVSINSMHHWKSPVTVLEEVFHVLMPGGQFWIYDFRRDVPEEIWDEIRKDLSAHLRTILFFGPIASVRAAYTDNDLEKIIKQTHFGEGTIEKISLPLYGRDIPAFNLIKLQKPEQVREEA